MKIGLNEIWNFTRMLKKGEQGWSFSLVTGKFKIEDISHEVLQNLKSDSYYDTELLPSIFTFREILWQPDVFTEAAMSLPSLRILNAFCQEEIAKYEMLGDELSLIYASLLRNLGRCCDDSISYLENSRPDVKRGLGDLRTHAFPIIQFFINHPQNRADYYRDAVNRLNYAVKIMLTQFHGRYTELQDPYWEVRYTKAPEIKEELPET
ncbi:MAG: hypothetical protein ACI9A7_001829 [Cyclobacteriaceae bacterium]|jgi:hypothetical protein